MFVLIMKMFLIYSTKFMIINYGNILEPIVFDILT
jgi:hypothetical protein